MSVSLHYHRGSVRAVVGVESGSVVLHRFPGVVSLRRGCSEEVVCENGVKCVSVCPGYGVVRHYIKKKRPSSFFFYSSVIFPLFVFYFAEQLYTYIHTNIYATLVGVFFFDIISNQNALFLM